MQWLSTVQRCFTHMLVTQGRLRKSFSVGMCQAIEQSIVSAEKNRSAEIRFVVEGALDFHQLWTRASARDRALQLFSDLHMWDTEHNSGVLVYTLFAEQKLEIVADRGISAKVAQQEWNSICSEMTAAFQRGQFQGGSIDGLRRIAELLDQHFPGSSSNNPDELPNRVVVI